jgi:branched-chain amino acid aminotransferase
MNSICVNGKIVPGNEPVLAADNRGYRYGDGLFETIKLVQGKIVLEDFHFERLFRGLKLLKYRVPSLFTPASLRKDIIRLAKKNGSEELARVRLSVSRGTGGIYEDPKSLQWLIECWPLNESVNQLNENGLSIDIFPDAQKSCDLYSNLKSANFLIYVMAAQYAKENKLNDCLVSNTKGHLADSTISNIFLVKNKLIITPALPEACVNGVMRRWLIEKLKHSDFDLREGVVTKNDLEAFDEIFLTNAMGIRWVKQFRNKTYSNNLTQKIHKEFIEPLYS